jgi:hypothetical protein
MMACRSPQEMFVNSFNETQVFDLQNNCSHVFDMIDVAIASGMFEDSQAEGREENESTHG